MTPLPPHNGHLSTTATFFCPQGGSLRTADVFLRLLFAGYPGGRCGLERFHVVVCLFLVGFLLSSMPGGLVVFALRVRLAAKWFKWVFLFTYLFFIYSFDKKKVIIQRESASFYLENEFVSFDLFLR